MSLNRVTLVGRLTHDPELRHTTNGKQVVNFNIAVSKRIKPTDGSPDADFFTIVAWGQTAEYVSNYLNKGRLISVDGRLQSRKYTTQDGANREVVEIIAENIQGLDRPREDGGSNGGARSHASSPAPAEDEYDPFADE